MPRSLRTQMAMKDAGNPLKNNNPRGINQYKDCPASDDPRMPTLLKAYHSKGITDRRKISKLLLEEYGITMSESTVQRRRDELGLKASGKTTAEMPEDAKRQLVLDQMNKDTTGKVGVRTIKKCIFEETGISLTRSYITQAMQMLAPEAFQARKPSHKKAVATTNTEPTLPEYHLPAPTGILNSPPTPSRPPVDGTGVAPHSAPQFGRDIDPLYGPLDQEDISSSPVATFEHSTVTFSDLSMGIQRSISETTAAMATLTRQLRALVPPQNPVSTSASDALLKCLETAALLEREVARTMSI